jgi:hypothetical protein
VEQSGSVVGSNPAPATNFLLVVVANGSCKWLLQMVVASDSCKKMVVVTGFNSKPNRIIKTV